MALAVALIGFDPLRLTMLSVALTVVIMPLVVLPFLVLMNDQKYVKEHTSGVIANGVLAMLTIVGGILAVVVIPLEMFGG
jgi:Mn2+/Fe2+ NRAMP family transporter